MPRPPRLPVSGPARPASPPAKAAKRESEDFLAPTADPLGLVAKGAASLRAAQTESVGLEAFLMEVGDTLRHAHGTPRWVRCELTLVQQKAKGYWVLGLQETNNKGQKLASAEAMVWSQDADRIMGLFERTTGTPLTAGMQVLLRVELSFSAQWGLRLLGKGIDPQWTLGAAAMAQAQLRKSLEADGTWFLNQRLSPPADFTHVAILAPQASAGIEDFLKEAERLEALGLCRLERFHAAFEGSNAALEIPQQLDRIAQSGPFDAVFVLRGGGAAAGIAWLNQEPIVRAAAQCPYPLITGIGHERDSTLLDELAHTRCGTPSKAAAHLVGTIVDQARDAEAAWGAVAQGVGARLTQADLTIAHVLTTVQTLAGDRLTQQNAQVDALLREAIGLGPQATLQRGYALLQDAQGKLITSTENLRQLLSFQVVLADGSLRATPSSESP